MLYIGWQQAANVPFKVAVYEQGTQLYLLRPNILTSLLLEGRKFRGRLGLEWWCSKPQPGAERQAIAE
jgi:hypothetical protein